MTAEESRNYYNTIHDQNETDSFMSKDIQELNNDQFDNNTRLYIPEDQLQPKEYYMYIYTAVVSSIFLVGIVRSFAFYQVCLRASQRLHDLVFGSLIRATMRFFDTNPSGRILNRFSKDLGAIDELLPKATLDAAQIILAMCGSLVITCIANYLFAIPIVIIGLLFSIIRKIYLKTSKNVKRLEGMSK